MLRSYLAQSSTANSMAATTRRPYCTILIVLYRMNQRLPVGLRLVVAVNGTAGLAPAAPMDLGAGAYFVVIG